MTAAEILALRRDNLADLRFQRRVERPLYELLVELGRERLLRQVIPRGCRCSRPIHGVAIDDETKRRRLGAVNVT
jgi:hypothetical protein